MERVTAVTHAPEVRLQWGSVRSLLCVIISITALVTLGCSPSSDAAGVLGSPTTSVRARVTGPAGVFAGSWQAHIAFLTVDGSGAGILQWRVYRWCSEEPPPCDISIDSEIIVGGYATLVLDATSETSGSGEVLATTVPEEFPVGPLTARYDAAADLLYLSGSLFENRPLCGPRAEAGACGA